MVNAIIAVDSLVKQTSIFMKCCIPSPFKKACTNTAYYTNLGRIF